MFECSRNSIPPQNDQGQPGNQQGGHGDNARRLASSPGQRLIGPTESLPKPSPNRSCRGATGPLFAWLAPATASHSERSFPPSHRQLLPLHHHHRGPSPFSILHSQFEPVFRSLALPPTLQRVQSPVSFILDSISGSWATILAPSRSHLFTEHSPSVHHATASRPLTSPRLPLVGH